MPALAVVVALAAPAAAQAAVTTFTVTGFGDTGGSCQPPAGSTEACPTLRTAEAAAQLVSSPTNAPTIKLSPGTYKLSNAYLPVDAAMTITGSGMSGAPAGTTIEQTDGADSVIWADASTGAVTLQNLELTGGAATSFGNTVSIGGGIEADGITVLNSVLVSGNAVNGEAAPIPGAKGDAAYGGGIFVGLDGSATLNESAVTRNTVVGGVGGAAVGAGTGGVGGAAAGGGIFVQLNGRLTVNDSVISDNTVTGGVGGSSLAPGATGGEGATAYGGGIESVHGTTVSVYGTTVSGNVAIGGLGGAASTDGVGDPGVGGGIDGTLGSSMTIVQSTVAANRALGAASTGPTGHAGGGVGGGVSTGEPTTIVNSTITGNRGDAGSPANGGAGASSFGGGIFIAAGSAVKLASDTLYGNGDSGSGGFGTQGGNLSYVGSGGSTLSLADTIIGAGGATQSGVQSCEFNPATGFTDAGHNLEDDVAGACGLSPAHGDIVGQNPQLGALANNLGLPETLLPAATSPARGSGGACTDPVSSPATPLRVDERFEPRPAGGPCDIGAVQTQPPGSTSVPVILPGHPTPLVPEFCSPTGFTGDGTLSYSYAWLLDGHVIGRATGRSYTPPAADAHHALACRVTATSAYGSGSATSHTVTLGAAPPALSHVSESHRRWREAGKAGKHAPPLGTTFKFTLSSRSTVTLTFFSKHSGRKLGALTIHGRKGRNTVKFAGRLAHGKRLRPGAYVVVLGGGSIVNLARLTFTIVS